MALCDPALCCEGAWKMVDTSAGKQIPDEPQALPGLRIAEVSRQLGVPIPTLRSWERRYGIPPTARGVGKHRRYSESDLHTLRLMRDEIARGTRASLAAAAVRELLGITGPAAAYVAAVLDASERSDPDGVRARLSDAQTALGLGPCLDDVLLPAMQQIGVWWQTGRCTVENEHLTTQAAQAWLGDVAADAPPPVRTTPIVLACGPADLHSLGLEALEVLLRHQGLTCRQLGARTSVADLLAAVQDTGSEAVVVVSHLSSGRAQAVESLRAADRAGARVFYAGNAFTSPRSRRHLPGRFLGTRLQEAAEVISAGIP